MALPTPTLAAISTAAHPVTVLALNKKIMPGFGFGLHRSLSSLGQLSSIISFFNDDTERAHLAEITMAVFTLCASVAVFLSCAYLYNCILYFIFNEDFMCNLMHPWSETLYW